VSTTFPRTRGSQRGYSVAEVEDFLQDARTAYTAPIHTPVAIDARSIRETAFSLEKGGYVPGAVDAALERLEDAFATRERERALSTSGGDAEWYAAARRTAQEIVDRIDRDHGHRFKRVGGLSKGYSPRQVDEFADRLAEYFQSGASVTPEEVRSVVFSSSNGGYDEAQVDFFLDTVVSVMLAVR